MNQLEYNLLENYSSIIKQEFPNETKFSISFFADVEKYVDSIVPATIEGLNISNYIKENKITISTLFDYSSDVNNIDKLYSEINICTILDGFIEHKFIKIITSYLSAKESYDIILAPQNKLKTIIKLLKNRKELKINSSIHAPLIDLPVDEMEREIFDFLLNKEFDDFCSKYNIKKKRAFIFSGPPGCLSGDTLLQIKINNKIKHLNLEELYSKFTNDWTHYENEKKQYKKNHLLKGKNIYIQSLNNGKKLNYNLIEDISYKGKQEIFLLKTETNKQIKCTYDHPFKVLEDTENNRGNKDKDNYIELKDLVIGDLIYCKDTTKINKVYIKKGRSLGRKMIEGITYHPYAHKHISAGKDYKRMVLSRLLVEANMNSLSIEDYIYALRNDKDCKDKFIFLRGDQIVHHKDENVKNDVLSNLEVITKKEHDTNHATNEYFNDVNSCLEKVVSIEKLGIENVYDISIKDENYNFLANNIIVHNCGKSLTLSVIKAKAKEKNVTVIKYDSAQSFIEEYTELYNSQENRIIILEEFDTYTQERVQEIGKEEKDKVVNGNPVIKALLDLLDGIDQVSNCVFLFTTNHVEALDKAFVRPGRIDKVLVFNLPNKDQINRFLVTYLPEYNSITDTMIEDYLEIKKISPSYAMLKSIVDTIRIKEFWNKQENKNVKIDDDEIKIMIDQIAQSGNKNEKINDPKKYIL